MKINKNLVIELLQNELVYERTEHKNTLADLELEMKVRETLEEITNRIIREKYQHEQWGKAKEAELKELNADFFDLGDILMEVIKENKKSQPGQKPEDVVTGLDDFLQKQYEDRIDHLEALIFELGDDIDEEKEKREKTIKEMKREAYETGMAMGKLNKENKELKVAITKFKEAVFEDDREQITKEIEKAEEPITEKKISTTGEHTPKSTAKSAGENTITILGIKNKLCNKGYDVQDTGKSLLAKKPGNRHIEVKPAELPGSFKYIICGQTCYEFDQAIKASAYGAKAISQKLDAEAIS